MNPVVPETFAKGDACSHPTSARPYFHLMEIIIHPVLLLKPQALAAVLGKHRGLGLKCGGNIDREIRNSHIPAAVPLIDRVHEI